MNPLAYFELPATDLERAASFYEQLLDMQLERGEIDGYPMAFFPGDPDAPGATGAIVVGDVYRPTKDGAILYLRVADLQATLDRALKLGSETLYAPTEVSAGVWIAEISDSEGNRVALMQR